MPISLFDHATLSHYRETIGKADEFGHSFGGVPSSFGIRFANCEPLHLLYRLNLDDPAVNLDLPGLDWVLLFYHFSYAGFDGELIYRMVNDTEIELLAPTDAEFDADFPYPDYPRMFPETSISFSKQRYDPSIAEDALELAGIFGVDRLDKSEMRRAVEIVGKTSSLFSDWGSRGGTPGVDFPDRSPEDLVRYEYSAPFMQGAPLRWCHNPNCTAPIDEERRENLLRDNEPLDMSDIRKKSMHVFGLHQPESNDELMWGDPFVQLIFEVCECCRCIRVTNQCT